MTKGILTTKAESGYDDDRSSRYQFPKQYLDRFKRIVGDLAIYYEPRRNGGRSSYIAVVQIDSIAPDPGRADHFYAQVSQYLDFEKTVPFRLDGMLFERGLISDGKTGLSGDFRNAVRVISDAEFQAILTEGFSKDLIGRHQQNNDLPQENGFAEAPADFDVSRLIVEQITARPFRDEAFARQVKAAYEATCAFTGLSMRNGGGRTEVDAAHIKPVGDGHAGPDSIRNGIALSKTVHWMFDRGLLSLDLDFRILTARNLVPEPIQRLLRPSGYAQVPDNPRLQPSRAFLDYHRNTIFKESRT